MKTILSALAGVALSAFAADAQQISKWSGAQTTTYNGGTNTTPALSTNRFFTMDVPRAGGDIAIYVSYSFNALDGPLLMRFNRGIEPNLFETNTFLTWVIPTNNFSATGVAAGILTTNVSGIPYLRAHIVNTNASARSTNVTVSYGFKN